jgi:TolB protein
MRFLRLMCVIVGSALIGQAKADLEINITQGNMAPIPIAITDLSGESSSEAELGAQMTAVIIDDLKNCGLFLPIPKSAFIQKPETLEAGLHFSEWRLVKAENLVVGKVIDQGDTIRIEFRLFDTVRELQIEGQALMGSHKDWRRVAHKVADAIYKRLIGDAGYFDTQIVYVARTQAGKKRTERLAIVDQDGHNNRFITNGSSLVLTPRFSPDMRYVTYLDFVSKKPRVYIYDFEKRHRTLVGNFAGMTFAPRFSPDGGRIVMSFARNGMTSLYDMDLKTLKIRQLTFDPVIDTSPCYSPDGSKLVFNSDRSGQPHLYVMPADGGQANRISFGSGSYRTPVWSPRGDLIAFTKMYQGQFYIGVMRPDGSGERLITQGFLVEDPSWAPNGRVLCFSRQDRVGPPRLMAIDLTGYNERAVLTPTGAIQGFWSPLR